MPVIVGVLIFVRLSEFDVPVSVAEVIVGGELLEIAVSIVTANKGETVTFDKKVALACKLCTPSESVEGTVIDQFPAPSAMVEPKSVRPSNSCTVEPAAVMPAIVGWLMLVILSVLVPGGTVGCA